MPNQTELYKKTSNISRIIDYTNQVESFSSGVLDNTDPIEKNLINQINRNTNSIKSIVYKYIDTLNKQGFNP